MTFLCGFSDRDNAVLGRCKVYWHFYDVWDCAAVKTKFLNPNLVLRMTMHCTAGVAIFAIASRRETATIIVGFLSFVAV